MLNFREELNKIKEGINKEYSVEEYNEIFIIGLLAAIREYAFLMQTFHFDNLVFIMSSQKICVKISENNVSNLFSLNVKNPSKVFEFILNKFKEENFEISEETSNKFKVHLA